MAKPNQINLEHPAERADGKLNQLGAAAAAPSDVASGPLKFPAKRARATLRGARWLPRQQPQTSEPRRM